tara:strand:+ start:68795 stop:69709 length:915 start_codon:yes stop_codon:yes gene_type:complete
MQIKHLTGISDLETHDIYSILEKSLFYSEQVKNKKPIHPLLQDSLVANIFFENSTRTRFSFEVAQKRLGANVLNFDEESSSLAKGESLYDTLKTFESLGIDIAIIRHSDDNFINSLRENFSFSTINAGAGKNEHPTQSLLDLFTIHQEFKTFEGLKICICGDIQSSRVAKSNIRALKKLGVEVYLTGPEILLPKSDEIEDHCTLLELDKAIEISDVMMFLRIQHERHQTFEIPIEEYNKKYGLNHERLARMKERAIIMHPGPVNRDVEILSELVEHEKSRIFKQMENGVYTRMAILEWIMENNR